MSNKWQYRACQIVQPDGTSHWDVRSYHFNPDDANAPTGWSADSSYPSGETLEELKSDILKIAEGVGKNSPLVLYVYTCSQCSEQDARTEKDRTICKDCEEDNIIPD